MEDMSYEEQIDSLLVWFGVQQESAFEAQKLLKDISDLRLPHEWYTSARAMKRRITLHVGKPSRLKIHH